MTDEKSKPASTGTEELSDKELGSAQGGTQTSLGRENSIECMYFEDSVRTIRKIDGKTQG